MFSDDALEFVSGGEEKRGASEAEGVPMMEEPGRGSNPKKKPNKQTGPRASRKVQLQEQNVSGWLRSVCFLWVFRSALMPVLLSKAW